VGEEGLGTPRWGRIAGGAVACLGLWWFAHGSLTLLGGFRSLLLLPPPPPPAWRLWLETLVGLAMLLGGLVFYWRSVGMNDMRDIDRISTALEAELPGLSFQQLSVRHDGDDDGVWFFRLGEREVQAESPDGQFPFLLEGEDKTQRAQVSSLHEATRLLSEWLRAAASEA